MRPAGRRPHPIAALRTPARFRNLTFFALAGLWLIVPSGALVRLTDSGLGCPDWPLCEGAVAPAAASHTLIEYTNRGVSLLVTATCVLAWVVARRMPGRTRSLTIPAAIIAAATVGQIPLGGLTVLSGLHPLVVSSHFLLSIVALAAGAVLAVSALRHARGREPSWDRRRGPLAVVTAAAMAVVIVTGVLVTAAGPHSGDPDVIDRFGNVNDAAYVHVRAVVVFAALALALTLWLWRVGTERATLVMGVATLPLIAAQITIGEVQFRSGLPWEVIQLHVALAALLWTLVVATAWSVLRPDREPTREAEPLAPEPRRAGLTVP